MITIGMMSMVRSSRMPANSRRQNSASASPSTVSIATETGDEAHRHPERIAELDRRSRAEGNWLKPTSRTAEP